MWVVPHVTVGKNAWWNVVRQNRFFELLMQKSSSYFTFLLQWRKFACLEMRTHQTQTHLRTRTPKHTPTLSHSLHALIACTYQHLPSFLFFAHFCHCSCRFFLLRCVGLHSLWPLLLRITDIPKSKCLFLFISCVLPCEWASGRNEHVLLLLIPCSEYLYVIAFFGELFVLLPVFLHWRCSVIGFWMALFPLPEVLSPQLQNSL